MKSIIRLTEERMHDIVRESIDNVFSRGSMSNMEGSNLRETVRNAINEAFNKRSVLNKLYRITEPYTKSKYNDTAWQGVDDILNALEDAGYDVTVTVKDGGYRNSRGGNTLFVGDGDVGYWKEYDLEIPVDDRIIHGQIRCHAAGTVDDPFSSYDQTCTFW